MSCIQITRVQLLLALSLTLWIASGYKSVNNMEIKMSPLGNKTKGTATKCNQTDSTNISLTWSPKDLSPAGQVEVVLFYIVPYDMYGGFINASLYFHGESDPFLGYSNTFTCSDLKKYSLKCPLLRRTTIRFPKTITNLHSLTSFPGDYDAIIEVRNEKNQEMFCLNITLHIEEI